MSGFRDSTGSATVDLPGHSQACFRRVALKSCSANVPPLSRDHARRLFRQIVALAPLVGFSGLLGIDQL